MSGGIYLDYQATTPLAPEARAAMLAWLSPETSANPHSPHRMGREAAAAVELARGQVAALIGGGQSVAGGRVIFTSGATEAATIGIIGAARAASQGRRRIVVLASEHAAVLDTVLSLAHEGFEPVVLPVAADGLVDLDRARDAIDERTALVAAMLVNNEIGVIQPVATLSRLARAAGAWFFCDAVQGLGRVAFNAAECDLIAVSAHKLHGPKGVGALWLADGVAIDSPSHGGGQEAGIRSGTLSPALCAGFGAAAALMTARREADAAHVEALWQVARDALTGWTINGSLDARYHGNLNLRRDGIDAARLISDVRGVAFSAGSACASGSGRPSHVLKAIGLDDRQARSSIRIGFGRYTRAEELAMALGRIEAAAGAQRTMAA